MNTIRSQFTQLNSKAQKFYIEVFWILFKSFHRNKILSVALIFIRQMQEIAFCFANNGHPMNELQSQPEMLFFKTIIESTSLYRILLQIMSVQSAQTISLALTLTLNSFIIFSLLVLLTIFIFKKSLSKSSIHKIGVTLSFLFSIYNYIIFIPSLEISSILLSQSTLASTRVLTYFNFSVTWILGIITTTHDYDYSFENPDKLSRLNTRIDIFKDITTGLLCTLFQFIDQKLSFVVFLLFIMLKIVAYLLKKIYYNPTISLFYIQLTSFQFILCLIVQASNFSESFSSALFILLMMPISAKIGVSLKNIIENRIYNSSFTHENLQFLAPEDFDIYIHMITENSNYFYEDYMEHKQGVFYENLFTNHVLKCESTYSNESKCFCSRFQQDIKLKKDIDVVLNNVLGSQYRKDFMIRYVMNLYTNYLRTLSDDKKNQIIFSYLSFIIEKINIPSKSFTELLKIQQEYIKKQKWSSLFYVNILIDRSQAQFDQYFHNSQIQNQRLSMHDPITFDHGMIEFQQCTKRQLEKQIDYFQYLCSDYFNIEELEIISSANLKGIQHIRDLQKSLYEINPTDQSLNNMSNIFQQTFDFYGIQPRKLKQRYLEKNEKSLYLQDQAIKVFSPKSCSIFFSFINKFVVIKRTSKNFSSIFKKDQLGSIDQPVSSLLPKFLQNPHEEIVQNFINLGQGDSVHQGEREVFGLNGKGFIFPMNIRIKLEYFQEDFGVTALISAVNEGKQYIFFNDSYNITDISEGLQEMVFSSEYSQNQLRSISIFTFIPLVETILEQGQISKSIYYQSCLILFKANKMVQSSKSIRKGVIVNESDEIFSIIFRVKTLSSSQLEHIKYIEIEKFCKERTNQGRQSSINLLKKCISTDVQIQKTCRKMSIDKDLDNQLNLFPESNSLQIGSSRNIGKYNNQIRENNSALRNVEITDQIDENEMETHKSEQIISQQLNSSEGHSNSGSKNINNNNIYAPDSVRENSVRKYNQGTSQKFISFNLQQDDPKDEDSQFPDLLSYQRLITNNNITTYPQSQFNPTNLQSPKSVEMEGVLEQSPVKKVKAQQLNKRLSLSKQILLKQQITNNNMGEKDIIESQSLKFAICDINQIFVDKWSEIPTSTMLSKNFKTKSIDGRGEEYDEDEDFQNYEDVKKKYDDQRNDSSNSDAGGKIKDEEQLSAFTGSQASQMSQKKIMIRNITSNHSTGIIKIIVATGIFSIAFLYISLILFYLLNENNLNSLENLFDKLNFATYINEGVFMYAKEESFIQNAFIFKNIFELDHIIQNPENPQQQITMLQALQRQSKFYLNNIVTVFGQNINSILKSQDEIFFDYISSEQIPIFTDYQDRQMYTHDITNHTILYSLVLYEAGMNQIFIKQQYVDYYVYSLIYGNIQTFNEAVSKIEVMISDQMYSIYQSMNKNQIYQLIQTAVSALVLVIVALPFTLYFKSQQISIIKLLGSFQPSHLENYIQMFHFYLNRLEYNHKKEVDQTAFIQSYNFLSSNLSSRRNIKSGRFDDLRERTGEGDNKYASGSNYSLPESNNKTQNKQKQRRQRQIASFSQAHTFKWRYLFLSLLGVSMFFVYPVISAVNTNLFVNEGLTTLTEREIILNASQFILNFEVVHYKIWEIIGSMNIHQIFFYQYGLNITSQTDTILKGLKNLANLQTSNRYDYNARQILFEKLLQGSICDYLEEVQNKTIINPFLSVTASSPECHTLINGSLDRGFILGMQSLIGLYTDWFNTYIEGASMESNNNSTTAQQMLQQYVINIQLTHNNLLNIYYTNNLLQELMNSFEGFFLNQNIKYTNEMRQVSKIMLILQMIFISVAIFLVWAYLYTKFKRDIYQTKLLITNLHIDLVLENKLTLIFFRNK